MLRRILCIAVFFFFNDTATTEIYTLSLHDALPISRVINVDQNPAYPKAVKQLKEEQQFPQTTQLRPVRYLNNRVEQNHRRIKRLVKPGLGFGSFNTARRTLKGYEAMSMIGKGQICGVGKKDVMGQLSFIHYIFGVAS